MAGEFRSWADHDSKVAPYLEAAARVSDGTDLMLPMALEHLSEPAEMQEQLG